MNQLKAIELGHGSWVMVSVIRDGEHELAN